MAKRKFITIEEMLRLKKYDGLRDMLFELENTKQFPNINSEAWKRADGWQDEILNTIPLKELAQLAVTFFNLSGEKHNHFLALSTRVRKRLYERWGDIITKAAKELVEENNKKT